VGIAGHARDSGDLSVFHDSRWTVAGTQASSRLGTCETWRREDPQRADPLLSVRLNLLEEPVAEPGNLCVYTGCANTSVLRGCVEDRFEMEKTGIFNVGGQFGASPAGASIGYENETLGVEGYVRASGTWAVTG
jgi:hypothetical protein